MNSWDSTTNKMNRVDFVALMACAFLFLGSSQSSAEPQPKNDNQTQAKIIRDALSQMDRDLEDFHKARTTLLTNLPAQSEPGDSSVNMVKLVSDGISLPYRRNITSASKI
jgi:hypothetical protein